MVSVLEHHTCPASTHYSWRGRNSVRFLASNTHNIAAVQDDARIKPRTIQLNERMVRGNAASYMGVWRAKQKILQKLHGDEKESFKLIPSILSAMENHGEGAWTELDICPETQRFRRCWVFPKALQQAALHCRKLVCMDGTHCKTRFKYTVLAITTIDGDKENLPLAWALVSCESEDNWKWFLGGIAQYLPLLGEEDAVIISDRQRSWEVQSDDTFLWHSWLLLQTHRGQHCYLLGNGSSSALLESGVRKD